ncbi:enoyl-CoA hydratase/isomerase family protein [Microbispora bryophytorum]|uniref:enoyl-CoA hydratase/isomerase family protein n=1 Tax=Microbispora bryophytorum TaxID=1460882 RepID=UPI003710F6A9
MEVTDGFELAIDDHVATLTLNRPATRNAVTAAMWRALPGILADLAAEPKVRVLLLTGVGGTFCSGADISEIHELGDNDDDTGLTVVAEHALVTFPKPVIAMIEGYCVGGGCQLALACDLRIAATGARFGVTPAKLGIVYPLSSTRRLAEIAGPPPRSFCSSPPSSSAQNTLCASVSSTRCARLRTCASGSTAWRPRWPAGPG